jgi:hypothetical protein
MGAVSVLPAFSLIVRAISQRARAWFPKEGAAELMNWRFTASPIAKILRSTSGSPVRGLPSVRQRRLRGLLRRLARREAFVARQASHGHVDEITIQIG